MQDQISPLFSDAETHGLHRLMADLAAIEARSNPTIETVSRWIARYHSVAEEASRLFGPGSEPQTIYGPGQDGFPVPREGGEG